MTKVLEKSRVVVDAKTKDVQKMIAVIDKKNVVVSAQQEAATANAGAARLPRLHLWRLLPASGGDPKSQS